MDRKAESLLDLYKVKGRIYHAYTQILSKEFKEKFVHFIHLYILHHYMYRILKVLNHQIYNHQKKYSK